MGRKKKSQPWGVVHKQIVRPNRKNPNETKVVEWSFQPKGLTRGIKRQIRRDLQQNPHEAHRKMALLGVTEAQVARGSSKKR